MAEPWPQNRHLEHRTRALSATNVSAEFILNSVALAGDSQYVAELDRFVPLPEAKHHEDAILALWEDPTDEKEKLFASMELLRQQLQVNETTKTATDLRKFTWQQVITEIQRASDSYRTNGGRIKKIFRNMCENTPIFEHWLGLLPNGDYGASISGAFVMIVKAANTMNDVQQAIYDTLAGIPDSLAHAKAYVEIYKAHTSTSLVKNTAALCKSILVSLQLIIRFFLKGSFKRGAASLFKGNSFEKELMESIQNIKVQVLNLREEANLCLQQRIAEMDSKNDVRAIREKSRQDLAKEELLLAIDSSTEITAQKVCTYLLRQLQANPDFSVRMGTLSNSLVDSKQSFGGDISCSEMVTERREGPAAIDLLKILKYDEELVQTDVEACLTLGYTQSDTAHARSTWVLHSTEIGEFLAGSGGSALLLINGNSDATEFISPLSFVCAKISDMVSVSRHILLAIFFCGRHPDELRNPRANAKGLLASLTGQLLMQVEKRRLSEFEMSLPFVDNDTYNAIHEEDMEALFRVFRGIVTQLPKGTIIFLLVDSLSAYENSTRKEDTVSLMRKLARFVKSLKNVALKVLITCPGQSMYADRWTSFTDRKAQMLHVPEYL